MKQVAEGHPITGCVGGSNRLAVDLHERMSPKKVVGRAEWLEISREASACLGTDGSSQTQGSHGLGWLRQGPCGKSPTSDGVTAVSRRGSWRVLVGAERSTLPQRIPRESKPLWPPRGGAHTNIRRFGNTVKSVEFVRTGVGVIVFQRSNFPERGRLRLPNAEQGRFRERSGREPSENITVDFSPPPCRCRDEKTSGEKKKDRTPVRTQCSFTVL